MKITNVLSILTALTVLASPAALAAKKAPGEVDPALKAARKAARQAIAKYDKNEDGAISGEESAELRKAFEADKTGPLKTFDKNADGTLDDTELATIKAGKGGRKKAKAA